MVVCASAKPNWACATEPICSLYPHKSKLFTNSGFSHYTNTNSRTLGLVTWVNYTGSVGKSLIYYKILLIILYGLFKPSCAFSLLPVPDIIFGNWNLGQLKSLISYQIGKIELIEKSSEWIAVGFLLAVD